MGYLMGKEIFWFGPSLTLRWPFKMGNCQTLMDNFASTFSSNPCNLGLEWTFWTFSVLKIIVLSLAIWWTLKYFAFGLICACGVCSNRVTVGADFAIFWGGLLFEDFTLACCQPNVPCPWTPPPPSVVKRKIYQSTSDSQWQDNNYEHWKCPKSTLQAQTTGVWRKN